jgi:hypothetical protein
VRNGIDAVVKKTCIRLPGHETTKLVSLIQAMSRSPGPFFTTRPSEYCRMQDLISTERGLIFSHDLLSLHIPEYGSGIQADGEKLFSIRRKANHPNCIGMLFDTHGQLSMFHAPNTNIMIHGRGGQIGAIAIPFNAAYIALLAWWYTWAVSYCPYFVFVRMPPLRNIQFPDEGF